MLVSLLVPGAAQAASGGDGAVRSVRRGCRRRGCGCRRTPRGRAGAGVGPPPRTGTPYWCGDHPRRSRSPTQGLSCECRAGPRRDWWRCPSCSATGAACASASTSSPAWTRRDCKSGWAPTGSTAPVHSRLVCARRRPPAQGRAGRAGRGARQRPGRSGAVRRAPAVRLPRCSRCRTGTSRRRWRCAAMSCSPPGRQRHRWCCSCTAGTCRATAGVGPGTGRVTAALVRCRASAATTTCSADWPPRATRRCRSPPTRSTPRTCQSQDGGAAARSASCVRHHLRLLAGWTPHPRQAALVRSPRPRPHRAGRAQPRR